MPVCNGGTPRGGGKKSANHHEEKIKTNLERQDVEKAWYDRDELVNHHTPIHAHALLPVFIHPNGLLEYKINIIKLVKKNASIQSVLMSHTLAVATRDANQHTDPIISSAAMGHTIAFS